MTDNPHFWDQRIVCNIIRSPAVQLKALAHIAGISIDDVFRYGDMTGIDLRGQDLSGIDLSKVNLSSSLYDMTTILDDERSLHGGEDNLLAALEAAVSDAVDLPDARALSQKFRAYLLKVQKVIFFIGDRQDFVEAMREIPGSSFPDIPVRIAGGYYKRDSLIIAKGFDQSILAALFDYVETNHHSLLRETRFDRNNSNQLELPLDEYSEIKEAIISESIDNNRLLSRVKSREKIGSIWIAIDTSAHEKDIRAIQDEINRIIQRNIKINIILICNDTTLINSSWRQSTISDREIAEFRADFYKTETGLQGFLRSVSSSMANAIKFSAQATSYVNNRYRDWEEAKYIVRDATRMAILKSRRLPINVGVRYFRDSEDEA